MARERKICDCEIQVQLNFSYQKYLLYKQATYANVNNKNQTRRESLVTMEVSGGLYFWVYNQDIYSLRKKKNIYIVSTGYKTVVDGTVIRCEFVLLSLLQVKVSLNYLIIVLPLPSLSV